MVSYLTGPDNWSNYSYIGQIISGPKGLFFRTTKASGRDLTMCWHVCTNALNVDALCPKIRVTNEKRTEQYY